MITHILAVLGIVWIISDSRIMKNTREWLTKKNNSIGLLLDCWGCLSLWVVLICFVLIIFVNHDVLHILEYLFAMVFIAVMAQTIYDTIKKL